MTVRDSVASTGVLRFVKPNSIRAWSSLWNSGPFSMQESYFLVFFGVLETCLS